MVIRGLAHRIGRRGATLLIFAFINAVIAWTLIDPSQATLLRHIPSYRGMLKILPMPAWGLVWSAAALSCVFFAFRVVDRIGFSTTIGVYVLWALGFLTSWIVLGIPRAWLGAATWGVMAGLVFIISGWPETLKKIDYRMNDQ